jgi:N-acetylmuramoyl-L-alanine amidase
LVQPVGFNRQERRHGLVILKSSSRHRSLWGALALLAALTGLITPAAHARARHSESWAREHFAAAERMREALNGRPPAEQTRRDYQRVLNAYRTVYMGAPSSTKADPSVVAVAETLVEMGRRFDDDKILNEAIDQYKFLRREYPGSKYRFDGLFTIGEIYKDDLNNPEAARSTFQEFLHRYPRNRLADDAQQAIAELDQQARADADSHKTANAKKKSPDKTSSKSSAESANERPANDRTINDRSANERSANERSAKDRPANDDAASTVSGQSENEDQSAHSGRLPRVTAIRHWSTPDYTRVAIDIEGDVKFSSQRIASPARIFFDLKDTKLASTLVGKSFDVDDGFLKKVRVAQFAPGRTRVVLEVENLSEYDAFLLPNPYRLIIDVHGKNGRTKRAEEESVTADADGETPTKPAETGRETASEKTKSPVFADASPPADSSTSTSSTPAVSEARESVAKKSQNTVVKKIVDNGDDDAEESATAAESTDDTTPPKHAKKLASHEGIVVDKVAKADIEDLSQTSDSGLTDSANANSAKANSASHGNSAAQHKSSSRNLASNKSQSAYDLSTREAMPTSSGDRSLIRALGLKIGKIVIDPGHGGHDTGTIGPNGLEEKDLVLDVGRRLGKLLETRLGAEVVYTRKDDTFIPLETRTAVANQARADLFVSIHANSSHDPDARGVETYYLNFTSSPEALDVAARENAVSEKSIYELQDLVKKIALKEKIEESREFAGDVQQSLHSGLAAKSPAIRDRGVKKAPFIVLIGANMPSILAEISFVSNPTDEHRLATGEYRQRIAESLDRGIAKYVNGLSGVKVASKMDKGAGQ